MVEVVSYPGVYVEEVMFSGRTIAGVPTSVVAFVGATKTGPVNAPVAVHSFAEFTAQFGGLSEPHPLSYAVQHYFANGGREALVARVAPAGGATITDAHLSNAALEAQSQGLWLLDHAERFNILCIPPLTRTVDVGPATWNAAANYAAQRGAMLIVDAPAAWTTAADASSGLATLINRDAAVALTGKVDRTAVVLSHAGMTAGVDDDKSTVVFAPAKVGANVAVYFPRLQAADPLRQNEVESFAPCGAVAGIYASTDTARGVWKAPAGVDTRISGAQALSVALTDDGMGVLNTLGINNLRKLPNGSLAVWGARTLGEEARRYVPVVRTELYVEQSIRQSLGWVVFEPNHEPTWANVRTTVGAFLFDLWRSGGLQGTKPSEAYFVRCDGTTTSQADIAAGRLNVVIGIAPLKPAEFVILSIGQIAGGQTAYVARHLQLAMGRYSIDASWDGALIAGVTHVRGLSQMSELVTHRDGVDAATAHLSLGRSTYGPVTLVRPAGLDDAFARWAKAVRDGAAGLRKEVRIEIHDRESQRTVTWRLSGALPKKYDAPDFNAAASEVAIEEIVLACERIEAG